MSWLWVNPKNAKQQKLPLARFWAGLKARNPGGNMHRVTKDDLPLARLYRWERERAERVFLTQPFGGGKVRDWTWKQVADEVRRMAAYLKAQEWEPGSPCRNPLSKLRLVDHGGFGHLDGRACERADLPVAELPDRAVHSGAQ